ncbi:MAG: hypothetical protein U0S12_11865 [Fimbriimonadales bacterium]
MSKVVAGLAALIALSAGILAKVDPITCLQRGAVAYIIGWFGTQVWYVFFTVRVQPLRVATDEEEADPGEAMRAKAA